MAREMIAAALDAGVPCVFVLVHALYGSDDRFRRMLEGRGQPYVLLAVRSNQHLRLLTEAGLVQTDPAYLAMEMEGDDWQALSAGEGARGLRRYHWARMSPELDDAGRFRPRRRRHTGHPLTAPPATTAIYLAIMIALVLRLAAAFNPNWTFTLLPLAGLRWVLAFAGFCVV